MQRWHAMACHVMPGTLKITLKCSAGPWQGLCQSVQTACTGNWERASARFFSHICMPDGSGVQCAEVSGSSSGGELLSNSAEEAQEVKPG